MKRFATSYTVLLALFLIAATGFAQHTLEGKSPTELVKRLSVENAMLQMGAAVPQINTSLISTNSIFIEQIGSNNRLYMTARTESSNIDLAQYGDQNTVRMNITALTVNERIMQQGNNNFLAEFSNSPSLNIQRTISQIGSDQNLMIHGSNSLSEKMRVTMEGNAKTIVIRNFN